jgi:hypothetical protein
MYGTEERTAGPSSCPPPLLPGEPHRLPGVVCSCKQDVCHAPPVSRGVPQRHAWGVLSKECSLAMAAAQPVDKQQCLEKVCEIKHDRSSIRTVRGSTANQGNRLRGYSCTTEAHLFASHVPGAAHSVHSLGVNLEDALLFIGSSMEWVYDHQVMHLSQRALCCRTNV